MAKIAPTTQIIPEKIVIIPEYGISEKDCTVPSGLNKAAIITKTAAARPVNMAP